MTSSRERVYLVHIPEKLLLLEMVQGVGMGHIVQSLLGLQRRKHDCILSLRMWFCQAFHL